MDSFDNFRRIKKCLRAEDGCPWDREQTHGSLKAPVIEEAAEVISGINIYDETGNPENLKEELGDLLLLIVMQPQPEEESLSRNTSAAGINAVPTRPLLRPSGSLQSFP